VIRHLGVTLALLAAPLAAQQTVRERLEGRVPADVAVAVDAVAAQAAAEGLPVELLVQKALEGAAKGVPAERVIAAVQVLAARLAAAGIAVRVGSAPPAPATVEAGTIALTAGLTEAQVQAVAAAAPGEAERGPALRAAATLAALGVPGRETVDLVVAAVAAGRPPAELLTLPQQVRSRMALGQTPAQAASGLTRAAAASQGRPSQAGPPPERPMRQNPGRP
jgi:hypothetical protein